MKESDELKRISDAYSSLKEQYYELKKLSPHAKSCQVKCATLMQKVSDQDKMIRELESKVVRRDTRIKELTQVIETAKKAGIPVDGEVIIQVTKHEMGRYVPQATYLKLVEELKQLKEKYEPRNKENAI